MRWLFRWAFRLFLLLIVLAVAAILLLDTIAREIAEHRIRKETGLEVKIGKFHVGLLDPELTVENLVLYNNAEFGGSPLIVVPELHAEYVRSELRSYRIKCRLLRLNLAELNFVESRDGRLNLAVLGKTIEQTGDLTVTKGRASKGYQFVGINTLNLTLGRATYMSMKQPSPMETLKADMHNQVLTNVTGWNDLAGVDTVILLRNGVNVLGKDPNPRDHWRDVFVRMGWMKN